MSIRTLENTGTCACCGQNVKLGYQVAPGKIGRHGFKRPRFWQVTVGRCTGTGFPPIEVSPEGSRHLREAVTSIRDAQLQQQAGLRDGSITEVIERRGRGDRLTGKKFDPNSPHWEYAKRKELERLEMSLRRLHQEVQDLDSQIQNWRPTPLPGQIPA